MLDKLIGHVAPRLALSRKFERQLAAGKVRMGQHSYGIPDVREFEHNDASLTIGKFVSIAKGVTIFLGGNHPTDRVVTFPLRTRLGMPSDGTDGYPSSKGEVHIGHDVWIGQDVIITSGVTVGNGAVLGAGAVVSRDVPAYAIFVGNPGRVVKMRFEADITALLDELQWWDAPQDWIRKNVAFLSSTPSADTLDAMVRERHNR